MTVYVDAARIPATVGRIRTRWSHLTADTHDELHEFAERIGLRRSWFQGRCKTRCAPVGQPCPHWHYDVTESVRARALTLGAEEIDLHRLGEIIRSRRIEVEP